MVAPRCFIHTLDRPDTIVVWVASDFMIAVTDIVTALHESTDGRMDMHELLTNTLKRRRSLYQTITQSTLKKLLVPPPIVNNEGLYSDWSIYFH